MAPLANARWRGSFTSNRIGPWQFTVEASLDEYATLCRAIRLKREAGVDISVELAELRLALEAAIARTACTRTALADVLAILGSRDHATSLEALTSAQTPRTVAESGRLPVTTPHEP